MTQAETRSIGYGIAASLALHLLVFVAAGIWLGLSAMHSLANPAVEVVEEEPEVTLLYADAFQIVPPEPALPKEAPKQERYVRTTQNDGVENAPENPDFISDRNTVASATMAPKAGGDATMPNLEGVEDATFEVLNRQRREGELKNDSAPASKPAMLAPPPSASVAPPPPPEVPKPEVAKKQDSPTEKMMQELDEELNGVRERLPLEVRLPDKPTVKDKAEPDEPPQMKPPEQMPVPKAEPVPEVATPEEEAFQPHTRIGRVSGGLAKGGTEDSFAAAGTARGRYMSKVTTLIDQKWKVLSNLRADAVQPGRLRVLFRVSKDGKVRPEDVKILFSKADPLLTDFTLSAILEASLPPIPADLLPTLDQERVEFEIEFVMH